MMATIKAANRVSELWGDDPRLPAPEDCRKIKIKRAIVIFFEPFSRRVSGKLFTRVFYKDFQRPATIENIHDFEKSVIRKYYSNELPGEICNEETAEQFPHYYGADISNIKFGRKACHVSYILKSAVAYFHDDNIDKYCIPMIFRKDKIIQKTLADGQKIVFLGEFEPNHSFYNLKAYNSPYEDEFPNVRILRVHNFMRQGPNGGFLDEDDTSATSRLDFAVDIPLMVEQGRRFTAPVTQEDAPIDGVKAVDEGSGNFELNTRPYSLPFLNFLDQVAIVFDPPQSNGGNTGPP